VLEVAHGCNARVVLEYKKLPFYADALAMYKKGETTGSNKANRAMVAKHHLDVQVSLSAQETELLYDPQTSGGLLLAVPGPQADGLIAALRAAGVQTAIQIGEVIDAPVGITVV